MGLNESQRLCAETSGKPIAVIAGAGSGKTSTLKERIANSFDKSIVQGQMEVVDDINQVLAITFTEKAALELKSRIKSTLRTRGLPEQAMLVDGAWISTIHSMCARVLRENAFSLGLDPAFSVLTEDSRLQLLDETIETTLTGDLDMADDVALLFTEYKRNVLKQMIADLIDKAMQSADLFDSLVGPEEGWGTKLFGGRTEEFDLAQMVALGLDISSFSTRQLLDTRLSQAQRLWRPLERVAERVYDRFHATKVTDGVFDNNDLLLEAAKALSRDDIRQLYADRFKLVMIDEFQDTDELQLGIIKAFAGEHASKLCVVGDPQQSIYRFRGADLSVCSDHLKTVEATGGLRIALDANYRSHSQVLDFVDLVFGETEAAGAVDDEMSENDRQRAAAPSYYQKLVAARDESRVKESKRFDTSVEGPRIIVQEVQHDYRGRSVARRFEAARIAESFKRIHESPKGRSYGDMVILLGAMTNAGVYAEALDEAGIPCAITGGSVFSKRKDAILMVDLARVLANPRDSEALCAVLSSDIFGFQTADLMAMTSPSASTGGATDGGTTDGGTVDGGTVYATNDIGVAFASRLSNVTHNKNTVEDDDSSDEGPTRLDFAVEVFCRAFAVLQDSGVAAAMEGVLTDSGWLMRMMSADVNGAPSEGPSDDTSDGDEDDGAETQAVTGRGRVADALKAIRMVRALEQEGLHGARSIAEHLGVRLSIAKEAPGVLSAAGNAFVRIMTIHASKGLQFPVVAVCELAGSESGRGSKLTMETSRGKTYVVLDCGESLPEKSSPQRKIVECTDKACRTELEVELKEALGIDVVTDDGLLAMVGYARQQKSLGYLYTAIRAFGDEQETEELERKLYVAFTRAEEALIVSFRNQVTKDDIEDAIQNSGYDIEALIKTKKSKSKKISPEEKARAEKEYAHLIRHVSLTYLSGNIEGVPARIKRARREIEAQGGDYRLATNAWLNKWECDGSLPPAWRGAKGAADDRNGFDLGFKDPSENSEATDATDASEATDVTDTSGATDATDATQTGIIAAIPWWEDFDAGQVEEVPFEVPACFMESPQVDFRYSPQWASGLLSASALKKEGGEHAVYLDQPMQPGDLDEDPDETPASAPEKGTAFHALAQWAALHWRPGCELLLPPDQRVTAIADHHGLNHAQREDLVTELERWVASPVAKRMAAHDHLVPEVPFFVPLPAKGGDASELRLNGFIDLLAYDTFGSGEAQVVDYKTGRFYDTEKKRRSAYEIQAQCYAYAVLLQGFQSVRLTFVFVDQPDPVSGDPSVVEFPADGEQPYTLAGLKAALEAACDAVVVKEVTA